VNEECAKVVCSQALRIEDTCNTSFIGNDKDRKSYQKRKNMERPLMKKLATAALLTLMAGMLSACGGKWADFLNRNQGQSEVDKMCQGECSAAYPNWETWQYKTFRSDQFFACAEQANAPTKEVKSTGNKKKKSKKKKGKRNETVATPTAFPRTVSLPAFSLTVVQLRELIKENSSAVLSLSSERVAALERNPAFQRCLNKITEGISKQFKQECADRIATKGTKNQITNRDLTRGKRQPGKSFLDGVLEETAVLSGGDKAEAKRIAQEEQALLLRHKMNPASLDHAEIQTLRCPLREAVICTSPASRIFADEITKKILGKKTFERKYPRCSKEGIKETCDHEYQAEMDKCLSLRQEKNTAFNKSTWENPCLDQCQRSEEAIAIYEKHGMFGREEVEAYTQGWMNGDKTTAGQFFADVIEEAHKFLGRDDSSLAETIVEGVFTFIPAWAGESIYGKIMEDAAANNAREYLIMKDKDLQTLTAAMEEENNRIQKLIVAKSRQVAEYLKALEAARTDNAKQEGLEKQREEILKELRRQYDGLQKTLTNRKMVRDSFILAQKPQLQKRIDYLEKECKKLELIIKELDREA
jgi:hypothetical protein